MRNVTLSFDEELLERGRDYARSQNISFNALVRKLVDQRTRPGGEWVDEAFKLADELKASSDRDWARDELYRY
jgi:hypothetical protein